MSLPYPPPPDADFGFGTAYERLAVYDLLEQWFSDWNPSSGLEGFHDGFTGLPGLHLLPLARAGKMVTVACRDAGQERIVREIYERAGLSAFLTTRISPSPADFPAGAYGVVLLFNPFPYVEDWQGCLAAAARLASDRLIVSVANPRSYGALFRRGLKRLRPTGRLDLFDHPATDPATMRHELSRHGRIEIEDCVDCPWWPDLFVEAGDSLASWLVGQVPFLGGLAQKLRKSGGGAASHVYGGGTFPYYAASPHERDLLRKKSARHLTFDRRRYGALKQFFAHHRIFVVRRPSVA